MKIQLNKEYGEFIIEPEGNETLENIACAVIISAYNGGQVLGLGKYRAYGTELTKAMALEMLNGVDISHDYPGDSPNKKNEVYMDYVFGRCCKTLVKISDGKVIGHISTRDQNPEKVLKGARELILEI
jgi:hypothetical protein